MSDLIDYVDSLIRSNEALAAIEGERALYWAERADEEFARDSATMAAHLANAARDLTERYYHSAI